MSHPEDTAGPKEIERKFLVQQLPFDFEDVPSTNIRQGYLTVGADGSETRLRDADGRYTLTVKTAGGLVRGEWETQLSPEQFDTLWPATEGRRLEKRRHRMPWDVNTLEVDVYTGKLSGLVMAEVEFSDVTEAGRFAIPPWFYDEVTGQKPFKNQSLALEGVPLDWLPQIKAQTYLSSASTAEATQPDV